ncbi:putative acid trehalase-like protein 1 [Apostichopus japonicus]|uniref:Protein-glucosylgalactosylhydroxylysine glucosidase n=1 Tax=Stichopus japonicus TaxID=307972 RepID=A0A2G8JDU5_STIJA|nr:putative acid trehalase-like protein 1 [Apostichopus japonicus]
MYPSILIFHPELARRMLESRTIHLDAAAAMAKSNGYDGIKFPWEMAYSGFEVCPVPPYSSNELHINGDIAFATQQYIQLTNDLDFLKHQGGLQLIEGLAKFWASKAVYDSKSDTYSIKDVMGPDEYHQNVTNSVYTNSIAKISLTLPSLAARKLGTVASPKWQEIADKLVIPFDPKKNYHPEFDGYQLGTRIKQADAILLGYPLMVNISETTRRNNLELYDTIDGYHVTDVNGPAMTWSMYVIGWLEEGNFTKAKENLKKSLLNLQQPFKVWTEEATGYGAVNFITGMGGFLQSIVYGYTGFRIKLDALSFGLLPSTSTEFNITGVTYLGNELDFRLTNSTLMINITSRALTGEELEVEVGDKTFQLKIGEPVSTDNLPGEVRKVKSNNLGRRKMQRKSQDKTRNPFKRRKEELASRYSKGG